MILFLTLLIALFSFFCGFFFGFIVAAKYTIPATKNYYNESQVCPMKQPGALITLNDYQQYALRTASPKTDWLTCVLGLNGESGEIADIVKKSRAQGHNVSNTDYVKELGDVLWYVAVGAKSLGYSLGEIAEKNVEKLKKRYPNGFEEKLSKFRNE